MVHSFLKETYYGLQVKLVALLLLLLLLLLSLLLSGVSISTDDRRNDSVILLSEVGYFSPRKKKQLVLTMHRRPTKRFGYFA